MLRAGKIKRKEMQETDPSSSSKDKDKETRLESPRAPSIPESSQSSAESREPGPRAKEVRMETNVNNKGKKVAGDENSEGKPAEAVNVASSKGSVRKDSPGDKKDEVGQDTKKSGGRAVNVTPVTATDNTTKPFVDEIKTIPLVATTTKTNDPEVPSVVVHATPSSGTPNMPTKKDDAAKEKVNTTINEENTERTLDGKATNPKESVVTDEGDAATPKRFTKELPASPAKSLKEKLVPTLDLTVPKSPKNGSDPPSTTTVTGATLSPLQKALDGAENETLMERVSRLKIEGSGFQPQKEVAPTAHTDLESDFECETAPSGPTTPKSKAGGSFNLLLSEIPLSDEDDFFQDCDSNASVSNFDGL